MSSTTQLTDSGSEITFDYRDMSQYYTFLSKKWKESKEYKVLLRQIRNIPTNQWELVDKIIAIGLPSFQKRFVSFLTNDISDYHHGLAQNYSQLDGDLVSCAAQYANINKLHDMILERSSKDVVCYAQCPELMQHDIPFWNDLSFRIRPDCVKADRNTFLILIGPGLRLYDMNNLPKIILQPGYQDQTFDIVTPQLVRVIYEVTEIPHDIFCTGLKETCFYVRQDR